MKKTNTIGVDAAIFLLTVNEKLLFCTIFAMECSTRKVIKEGF